MMSGSSSSRGVPGMNDAAQARTVITSGGCSSLRRAYAVTTIAPSTTRTSWTPFMRGDRNPQGR